MSLQYYYRLTRPESEQSVVMKAQMCSWVLFWCTGAIGVGRRERQVLYIHIGNPQDFFFGRSRLTWINLWNNRLVKQKLKIVVVMVLPTSSSSVVITSMLCSCWHQEWHLTCNKSCPTIQPKVCWDVSVGPSSIQKIRATYWPAYLFILKSCSVLNDKAQLLYFRRWCVRLQHTAALRRDERWLSQV